MSSVLSILAPNKLSDLTDEISKGLVVNQENMKELSTKINENITNKMPNVGYSNANAEPQNMDLSKLPKEMIKSF